MEDLDLQRFSLNNFRRGRFFSDPGIESSRYHRSLSLGFTGSEGHTIAQSTRVSICVKILCSLFKKIERYICKFVVLRTTMKLSPFLLKIISEMVNAKESWVDLKYETNIESTKTNVSTTKLHVKRVISL